ncbi:MAG: hypothetical protein MJB14_14090 [Spirochaetes bacterium]|nr:hypothetical protein [Spirochaetota bacterium]
MIKKVFLILLAFILLILINSCNITEGDTSRTLNITPTFKGDGTVSESRKLIVLVYDHDSPVIDGYYTETPSYILSTATNGETLTFSDISFSPCYVIVLWDSDSSGSDTASSGDRYERYDEKGSNPMDAITISEGGTVSRVIDFDDTYYIP